MLWLPWELTAVKRHLPALKPGLAALNFVHLRTIISPSTSIKLLLSGCYFAVQSWLSTGSHAITAITLRLPVWGHSSLLKTNLWRWRSVSVLNAGGQTCFHHKVTVSLCPCEHLSIPLNTFYSAATKHVYRHSRRALMQIHVGIGTWFFRILSMNS